VGELLLAIAESIAAAHKAIKRYVLYSREVNSLILNNQTKGDSPLSTKHKDRCSWCRRKEIVLFYQRIVQVLPKNMEGNSVISKDIEGGSLICR
jgi:hypothetical protein